MFLFIAVAVAATSQQAQGSAGDSCRFHETVADRLAEETLDVSLLQVEIQKIGDVQHLHDKPGAVDANSNLSAAQLMSMLDSMRGIVQRTATEPKLAVGPNKTSAQVIDVLDKARDAVENTLDHRPHEQLTSNRTRVPSGRGLYNRLRDAFEQSSDAWNFEFKIRALAYNLIIISIAAAAFCFRCRVAQVRSWMEAAVSQSFGPWGPDAHCEDEAALEARFGHATSRVAAMCKLGVIMLPFKMSLSLHGLSQQASFGDVQGSQPLFNLRARAHWNAWAAMSGLSKAEAMQRYIALVDKLCSSGAMPVHVTLIDEHIACKAAKTQKGNLPSGVSVAS